MGIQSNFSYFSLKKDLKGTVHAFEIHHNLAVQSAHHPKIFTTPDITIIKTKGIDSCKDHYETKITFSFVKQEDLITFCEVKQFNPYPELLFNFMGIVNELAPQILTNTADSHSPQHIAPTLMVSGMPNLHTGKIRDSLESRYAINIVYNLFYGGAAFFSKSRFTEIRQTGKAYVVDLDNKKTSQKYGMTEMIERLLETGDEPPF